MSICRRTRIFLPCTPSRTLSVRIILPLKVRISFIACDVRNQPRRRLQIARSLKDLLARDVDQTPRVRSQSRSASTVDALLEARPADRGAAHWTRLGGGVEGQLMPGFLDLCGGELVVAVRVGEHGGAVVDGCHFSMQGWVAGGDGIGADADEISNVIWEVGGVIDDDGSEGFVGAWGDELIESLEGSFHPERANVRRYFIAGCFLTGEHEGFLWYDPGVGVDEA